MSVVVFVPMESRGNFDPVKVYEELNLHYKTLQGRTITSMSCDCDCTGSCCKAMTFVYQISVPIISGVGQVILINLLPPPTVEINPAVTNDLYNRMLRYLSDSTRGRQFALDLGYTDVKKITFNEFYSILGGLNEVISGWNWCHDFDRIFYSAWELDGIVFRLGGFSLLSSLIVSGLDRASPFIIDRFLPADFPTEKYQEAKKLLKRTDRLMKRAADKLTSEQKSNLEDKQKSLRRLKNKVWIICGVSGSLFIADLLVKFYLVNLGSEQIHSKTNPQILYQPGLHEFRWTDNQYNATLLPADPEQCRVSYPDDFYKYAQETSTLPDTDLGVWKLWTAVMLPLAGRLLENLPVIYQTTKEAILRCRCCPKRKRGRLLNELE